jgi:hypothetical protein
MPVKLIAKEKAEAKKKTGLSEAESQKNVIAGLVESLASTKKKVDELKQYKDKYDKIRNNLADLLPANLKPEDGFTFFGVEHDAVFSSQANVRSITDMKALYKTLGPDVFFSICKVNLGDLDKYLALEEQKKVVTEGRTGSRTCSVKSKEN